MEEIGELSEIPGELAVQWKVKNFFSLSSAANQSYSSPVFLFAGAPWHLQIYPNGSKAAAQVDGQVINSVGYTGVFLRRKSSFPPITLKLCIGLKTVDEKIALEFYTTVSFDEMGGYGRQKFLNRSKLFGRRAEFASSDAVTLVCRLTYLKSSDVPRDRVAKCSSCKALLDVHEDMLSHEEKCMKKSTKSSAFDVVDAPEKKKYIHKFKETESKSETAECSHCKKRLDAKIISSHEKKCVDKPIKCPECSEIVTLLCWYEHECQKEEVKGTDTAECSYCKTTLEAAAVPLHEKSCMDKPMECSNCFEVVATKDWFDHKCLMTRTEAIEKLLHDLKKIMACGDHRDHLSFSCTGVSWELAMLSLTLNLRMRQPQTPFLSTIMNLTSFVL